MTAQAKRLWDLHKSANDIARHVRNVHITFMLVTVYVAITIGSTTDEQLLRINPVTLPLLNVQIPILGFFALVPWLVLLLHFNLLLQFYLLARALRHVDRSLSKLSSAEDPELVRDTLFSFVFSHALIGHQHSKLTRFYLGAIIWITAIAFPLVLLTWAQIRFIPFHDPMITGIHRIVVFLDVVALWSICPLIIDTNNKALHWWSAGLMSPYRRMRQLSNSLRISFWILWRPKSNSCVMKHRWQLYNRWQRRFTAPSPHAKGFLIFIMVSIAGLLASISAMVPDERIESWLLQRIPRAWQHAESQSKMGWWSVGGEENTASSFKLTYGLFNIPGKPFRQNLALAEAVLIAETPDPRALKAIRGGNEVERADAIKGISGLDLMGRNFRYGDMQRAILVSADLRNADLRGANLREADLGQVDASQTSLFSVNLENARLDGANLSYANLQGADLFAADLRSANLTGANLRSAQLEEADLRGALGLEKRRIQEANNWLLAYYNSTTLKELGLPQNHNERVKSKYFLNYQLPFANMIGSSLSMADLDGANLNRAVLDNSILIRASLKGGQLKNASLRKANLEEADLTKADLTDANLTGAFLPGSIFVEATLTRANLENTWLGGVHFQGARLDGANLKNATLSGASLMGATLKNADLSGAKLYSSGSGPESLGAAIVTFDQLSEVETLCNAQLEQEIRLQVEQKRPDLLCR